MSDLEHIKACLDAISDPAGKGGLLTSGRASAPRLADGRAGLILDVTGLSLDVRDALNAEVEAKLKALPGVNPAGLARASVSLNNVNTFAGKGKTENSNDFSGTITAVVTRVLPNGQSERIVRAMPNTPALVGLGQTGLFARSGVSGNDKAWVEWLVASTGQFLWVSEEAQLDAVTAVSGSGPAYVFYFIEAMEKAAIEMGMSPDHAKQLAIGTFVGASQLAQSAQEPLTVLRERVTSKGGTTHAAITAMQSAQVGALFQDAIKAAQARAQVLGDEFGKND